MNFTLLDKITSISGTKNIKATKCLSLGEEYLADHFPGNPVMPGVLQLETMIQTAAWLLRWTQDFAYAMITLHETRNVTYGRFVAPGDQLVVDVDALGIKNGYARFKGKGAVDGSVVVKAMFDLKFFNLADINETYAEQDRIIIESAKQKFHELGGDRVIEAVAQP